MRIKYIFLDIDGTLVNFDGKMPDSAREALLRAHRAGHKLVINTGRNQSQIYSWLREQIPFDGFITSSGANVVYDGKIIRESHMSHAQLGRLVSGFREIGAISLYHSRNEIIMTKKDNDALLKFLFREGLIEKQTDSIFTSLKLTDVSEFDNIEKAVYFDSGRTLPEMREIIGNEFQIDPYSLRHKTDTCGEVTLAGINKASGIKVLINYLGVPREDTIAIGDGGNDFDMVRFAGVGIAMGNAGKTLKDAADYITSDIDDDGLSEALGRLLGI